MEEKESMTSMENITQKTKYSISRVLDNNDGI
jgi:hypothetical protein